LTALQRGAIICFGSITSAIAIKQAAYALYLTHPLNHKLAAAPSRLV
jgi:hypothetical protein